VRRWLGVLAATAAVAACGDRGIQVSDEHRPAAELFAQRCGGCHTLSAAGTEGAARDARTRENRDGPNFDARFVSEDCALFAIRNGGFSSGPMPQNIVTGERARAIARFLAEYSGHEAPDSKRAQTRDCPAA
jgi:mono/diheme cytochrome c family protein